MADLTGRQKAAIFLIALGPEVSSRIFRGLEEQEIEALTLEIANLRHVSQDARKSVLQEFRELSTAREYLMQGGVAYAKEVLERGLGKPKAQAILDKLTRSLQVKPFDFLNRAQPEQICAFLQNEHPQTIALILSYLRPEVAAAVLAGLISSTRTDVARRMAMLDRTSPEVVLDVERVLEQRFEGVVSSETMQTGGVDALVQVLNRVDRSTERSILESLTSTDPELAEDIKRRMFLFEDIVHLDDLSLQRVMRDVDLSRDLPLALKVASDEVKARIFQNLSKRAAETIKETLELMGPVRLKEVEEAQQRIVTIVRRLEEEGEIFLGRGGGEELVV